MPKNAAGLLMYRHGPSGLEFFLVHPGGPYWKAKDDGAWTIPKGEIEPGEDALATAVREFEEEVGVRPEGPFEAIGTVKYRNGKVVQAWACRGEVDAAAIRSNTFTIEWPPRSGKQQEFPEVDRAAWMSLEEALRKVHEVQAPLLRRTAEQLAAGG